MLFAAWHPSLQETQAPINPSDINTIEGKYPLKPLHGIPGHEGVGEVVATGARVRGLSRGDWVVPLEPCVGTWRWRGVFPASCFHRVGPAGSLPVEDAATLCIK